MPFRPGGHERFLNADHIDVRAKEVVVHREALVYLSAVQVATMRCRGCTDGTAVGTKVSRAAAGGEDVRFFEDIVGYGDTSGGGEQSAKTRGEAVGGRNQGECYSRVDWPVLEVEISARGPSPMDLW